MKRFAAYDPPEYLNWTLDTALLDGWREHFRAHPERGRIVDSLSEENLLQLYRDLLLTRLHDIGLKRWVRTGVISKAWLGTGEEAVTVGTVSAIDRDHDVVSPMIRNAGALPMMGMPLADCFRGYLATWDSPSKGRDLHIGDLDNRILQPISHMGTNVEVMAGVAMSFRNRGEDRVALTWIGDGATKSAACHEGINLAAVEKLPVVYVIQNNQVALGTRAVTHGIGDLRAWADGYGIPSWSADGNNVLDVYAATRIAAAHARDGNGPAVVVAETFRMGGHATHDEREARETFPDELFAHWGARDPIGLFEGWLAGGGVAAASLEVIEAEVTTLVDSAAEEAIRSKDALPPISGVIFDGFSLPRVLSPLDNRLLSSD